MNNFLQAYQKNIFASSAVKFCHLPVGSKLAAC
jgi:hypothetical protein